jgi:ribosomal protein S18 acetylase RimI-like enzyme
MLVRAAREADVPALKTLLRNSWLTVWAPALRFETVRRFAAEDPAGTYAQDRWRDFVVAEEAGVVRGMFHLEGNHLHAIHLDHTAKRRGTGTLLMEEAERRAATEHAEAVLEVLAFNSGAIAFYRRRGWIARRTYEGSELGEPVSTIEMRKTFR